MFGVDEDNKLERLQALVRSQDQTASELRSALALARNKIENLHVEVDLVRRKASFDLANFPDQRREVESLQAALRDSQHRVKDLERSLSWRITGPLRLLARSAGKR